MDEQFERLRRLVGTPALTRLRAARAAVFGLGGVGSFCAEALARSGVGGLTLVDADVVDLTNVNRQAIAYLSTVGQAKTDLVAARVRDIQPDCVLDARRVFFDAATADTFDFAAFDYVVDCIDTVTSKLLLAERCRDAGTPLVMCMGTGNKLDPEQLHIVDIAKTSVCPLAKVMRRELRLRGISHLPVLYSTETPAAAETASDERRRAVPASCAFVPSVAGLMLAGHVVRALIAEPPSGTESQS